MDEYDEDEIAEMVASQRGKSQKKVKSFGFSVENQEFWRKLMELDKVVRTVSSSSDVDEPFIRLQASNPLTGEEWELPPARLKPLIKISNKKN